MKVCDKHWRVAYISRLCPVCVADAESLNIRNELRDALLKEIESINELVKEEKCR